MMTTKTNHKERAGNARRAAAATAAAPDASHARRAGERGYTLVALLAVMAILALAITAAAPSLRQQSQRMLEQEAIYRGQEVAEAIDQHRLLTGGKLPTSMDDLTKGVQVPGRINKVYLLRPSAARDPLTKSGEWKVVRANDREWREFQEGLQKYVGQVPIASLARDQFYVTKNLIAAFTGVIDVKQTEKGDCGEDSAANGTGEFIGVVSRSRCSSVLTFYGIGRHDRWVFTPVFK